MEKKFVDQGVVSILKIFVEVLESSVKSIPVTLKIRVFLSKRLDFFLHLVKVSVDVVELLGAHGDVLAACHIEIVEFLKLEQQVPVEVYGKKPQLFEPLY